MAGDTIFHAFFLIFSGAAVLASLALYTRQPLLIAYIALGALLGPYGFGLIDRVELITDLSHIGIIFLLFLLGLDMQPQLLFAVLRKVTIVTLVSCVLFAVVGYGIGLLFGYTHAESAVIGMAMMFSSTIIGIKLMPTTVLHHKHLGELMVGMLLIQDFIAILCLMVLLSGQLGGLDLPKLGGTLIALPLVGLAAWAGVRFVLLKLIARFDLFHEYTFLLALGWCLGLASLTEAVGLSPEIGAFIAGISLATSPISQYIATSLRPLRDFFLVLFFFALGAKFNLSLIGEVALAATVLALVMLVLKPLAFRFLLRRQSERRALAWDIGFRLGQISEFSLLLAFVATEAEIISNSASHLIQATAIITFLVSSYIVILNLPNPIAIRDSLRRD